MILTDLYVVKLVCELILWEYLLQLDLISYYSPVLEDAFDVIEIECAYTHEAQSLEQCHVHILRLIVVHRFVVRVLPNHRHFAFGHQVLNAFVNLSDYRVKLPYFLNFNPCCLCHFFIFFFLFNFNLRGLIEARMNGEGDLF